jgi:hypothetical protein
MTESVEFLDKEVQRIIPRHNSRIQDIISNKYVVSLVVLFLLFYALFPRKNVEYSDGSSKNIIDWNKFIIWYILFSVIIIYGLSNISKKYF